MEGNYERVVNCVCKYISKGLRDKPGDVLPTKVGGRWYYSGWKLGPLGSEFCNNNMEELESVLGKAAKRVEVEDLENVDLIVAWIDADGTARGTAELADACVRLGGSPYGKGDAGVMIPVFRDFNVVVQFWDSDEDFGPELNLFCDANALNYMHYETMMFMLCHVLERVGEMIDFG